MKLSELKELVRSTLREKFLDEMSSNDVHFKAIMKYYDHGTASTKKQVAIVVCGKKNATRNDIMEELHDMDYREILSVQDELKYVKEYIDKKGVEHAAAALPQTQEVEPEDKKLHNENKDCGCGCK